MAGKVITVAQQKGGTGKTTTTCHLAVALAKQGYKVIAVDVDPQGSLTSWYDARYKWAGEEAYNLLKCTSFDDWWRLSWELESLKGEYDFVVVDCPPHTDREAKTAIKEADMVVLPIQPSPTDLWATMKTVNLTNREHRNTYLLLNRVNYRSRLSQQFIRDLPRRRFEACFGNRVAFANSMSEGLTVIESEPSSEAAKEVNAVTQELITMINRIDSEQGKKASVKVSEKQKAANKNVAPEHV